MDKLTGNIQNRKQEKLSEAKLRSMETWENIQALTGNLLAVEDLNVVFDANIRAPAHIDLKRRIVRVAQLDPSQKHLIPGLIFHEISHAVWTKGNEPIDPVLNIIEDGYIERMGCKKYPGGKKHLRVVFDEFFNEEKIQKRPGSLVVKTLNALNYNCKGIKFGKTIPYPASLPENIRKFLQNEVETCTLETLEERHKLAQKVKKLLKPFKEAEDDFNQIMNNWMANNSEQEQEEGEEGQPQPQPGQGEGQEQQQADPGIDWDDDGDEHDDDDDQDSDGDIKDGGKDSKDGKFKKQKDKSKKGKKGQDSEEDDNDWDPMNEIDDEDEKDQGDDSADGDEGEDGEDGEDGDKSAAGDKDGDKDGDEGSSGKDGDDGSDGGEEVRGDKDSGKGSDGKDPDSGKTEGDSDGDTDGSSDEGEQGQGDIQGKEDGPKRTKTPPPGTPGSVGGSGSTNPITFDPNEKISKADTEWLDDHLKDKDNGDLLDHHEQFNTMGSQHDDMYVEIASPEAVFEAANKYDITAIPDVRLTPQEVKKVNRSYSRDLTKARKTAQLMYQRFLISKNAHDQQKVSYHRTGKLDIRRLPHYRTNDDIFFTKRQQPKGKNHAIVVMLDWSGSMDSVTMDLWERTAEYVEFARLAEVRVIVYAFTTDNHSRTDPNKLAKFSMMAINHGQFFKIVDTAEGSLMQNAKRVRKFWELCLTTGGGRGRVASKILCTKFNMVGGIPHYFNMGGTNILEGHAFASHIAQQLRAVAEKISTVIVCDGGDAGYWSDWVCKNDITVLNGDGEEAVSDSYNSYKSYESRTMVMHGQPLPKVKIKDGSDDRGYYDSYRGPRAQALLAQIRSLKKIGIGTVGIYIGYLGPNQLPRHAAPYEGKLIEWTDLAKGNSFIGVLINQIS